MNACVGGAPLPPVWGEVHGRTAELFFPQGFDPLSDVLVSCPCPMYRLGTGVQDASRLIDPRTPPHHQGVGEPPYGRATSQVLN
jgi:hypothetical protein